MRWLPYVGPAFIAAVAYIDPGNFATNIEGGARFGYTLLWVIAVSNLMAMLLQTLAAKLGVATGLNLAEICREHFPRSATLCMWVIMEIVAIATDLAEFLGAALGLHLIFNLPMPAAGVIAAVITLALLAVQSRGFRPMEILITVFVIFIAVCYVTELMLALPDPADVAAGLLPTLPANDRFGAIWLSVGMLGATVMPHALFLHSSLTQNRIPAATQEAKQRLHRLQLIDVGLAMPLAGLVNAAMLLTAAAAFYYSGKHEIAGIETAYYALERTLGPLAKTAFGCALLASGLSSSVVGTMAGQIMMQGFLRRHIPIVVRRVVTLAPALVVILLGTDPTKTLVASQVVLSLGLPFAVIPLIVFTARRDVMGTLANHPVVTGLASVCGAIILILNGLLVVTLFTAG